MSRKETGYDSTCVSKRHKQKVPVSVTFEGSGYFHWHHELVVASLPR